MRVQLAEPSGLSEGVRAFAFSDRRELGRVLFEAYLGTIDQAEDTLVEAEAEISKTLGGEYGEFMSACSMVAEREGLPVAATLLTRYRERPFVAFSVTRPPYKNQGLGRACLNSAMSALASLGEKELRLVVTLANAPAVHLYQSLGFEFER